MSGMEGLGRLFDVVPIAAGRGLSLVGADAVTFIVTGNDTFTLTCSDTFAGSYATPGNIITYAYTNTATNGSAAWVKTTQAAANTVVIASGTAAFRISASSLPDTKRYVKLTAGGSGLVTAILHDLLKQRTPPNLLVVSA